MSAALVPLKNSKTILLTAYKRDGTAVSMPVSIAFDGDRAMHYELLPDLGSEATE